ncbi:glycosyltransferase family 4 protein [Methanolinea mesophila]|uniref:glycosyltransferase family 4 protein n=1 Tax=Methanolinea mesophila TaxID=547055 RepID=UPI001FD7B5DE|nr:glycosyltransferase family 4 protein [Methanolinea mesophila]
MKKILVINDFPVFPPVHGGKIRILNIYRNISSECEVTYLCLGDVKETTLRSISDNFSEISVPKTFLYRQIVLFAGLIMKCPVDDLVALLLAPFNPWLRNMIRKKIRESDIVICCHPYMYPAVSPWIGGRFLVYEALNDEYGLKSTTLPEGFLKKIMLHRLDVVSCDLLRNCDLCFVVSEEDKKAFIERYPADPQKLVIAPNGVDTEYYSELYKKRSHMQGDPSLHPLVIFLGSAHPPNIVAARKVIHSIAPKLPDVNFFIAGSVCDPIINDPRGSNVTLGFYISDEEKEKLFLRANVAINPMTTGSGSNIKIFDYLASGIPVVTTKFGARGISMTNRVHAIVCDIDEFPGAITTLIDNKALSEVLSHNGRVLVEQSYDWKRIALSMVAEIRKKTEAGHSQEAS